ncbi:hypothetical protein ACPFL9_09235 [Paenarthrobacter sp. NyZ202]|uniref:hypothetical protein n=1 Tax=Paenarthrobacter sp. NyZ202 TaxID=3402689 RepID=UPI003CEFAEDB
MTITIAPMLVGLTSSLTGSNLIVVTVAVVAIVLLAVWGQRIRRLRRWQTAAADRWQALESFKQAGIATAEVTLLSVDAVQPTGTWVTIRWNRFNYIQPAWIEALGEPLWPGSVLLIKPDPQQVRPGSPWPTTYRITGNEVLAWAPSVRSKSLKQAS